MLPATRWLLPTERNVMFRDPMGNVVPIHRSLPSRTANGTLGMVRHTSPAAIYGAMAEMKIAGSR